MNFCLYFTVAWWSNDGSWVSITHDPRDPSKKWPIWPTYNCHLFRPGLYIVDPLSAVQHWNGSLCRLVSGHSPYRVNGSRVRFSYPGSNADKYVISDELSPTADAISHFLYRPNQGLMYDQSMFSCTAWTIQTNFCESHAPDSITPQWRDPIYYSLHCVIAQKATGNNTIKQ